MFKVEKVLDFGDTEFAKAFQEFIVKYYDDNIRISDNQMICIKLPKDVKDKIIGHTISITTKYIRSEKGLKDCVEMSKKYSQDQSENPSLHYIENIFEIIKTQIISSREAWEILKLLIGDKVESHEELAKWCRGKYNKCEEILKNLKKFYDIRGEIEHPSKDIRTTMLQKNGSEIMQPTATFFDETSNLFDLAIECLNVNFQAQIMFIELGYFYSKYVYAITKGGAIFVNKNFSFENDKKFSDDSKE